MKKVSANNSLLKRYSSFTQYLLRTPHYSIGDLLKIRTIADLKEACLPEEFQEAMFIASPDLYEECKKWLSEVPMKQKDVDKMVSSVLKYYLRMAGRSTPFGVFAGCSIGEVSRKTEIVLADRSEYRKHVRLDMYYLCSLVQMLGSIQEIRSGLLFYPNSSIYRLGKRIRYVEFSNMPNGRSYAIADAEDSEYLQATLELCKGGATIDQISALFERMGIVREDSSDFITELIDSQIIVNELEPRVTGGDYLKEIIEVIRKFEDPKIQNIAEILFEVKTKLEKLCVSKIGADLENYHDIIKLLEQLPLKFNPKYLFQVDMFKPSTIGKIDHAIPENILEGLSVLARLCNYTGNGNLEFFKDIFRERFEEQEVPLLNILDTESGIGYPANSAVDVMPLVQDLMFPGFGIQNRMAEFSPRDILLLNKYIDAMASNKNEVIITDNDLIPFPVPQFYEPETISVMASIGKGANHEPRIDLLSTGGTSAANLISRFCYLDTQIEKLALDITKEEELLSDQSIVCEILHLPESRIGNILFRPQLRKYEIPFLAKPSVDSTHAIKLNDLYVSIRNNKIILRSKSFNKEVTPRLTSAHNFSNSTLPVYRFLCDLQFQNRIGVGFYWPSFLSDKPHLPRVMFKNIVLSPQIWNLNKDDIDRLVKAPGEVSAWRNNLKIDRFVSIADGDNELFVDFENELLVGLFIKEIKKRNGLRLIESPIDEKASIISDGEERKYRNQFMFFFHRKDRKPVLNALENYDEHEMDADRVLTPGSRWIYYKLYCGRKTADSILTNIVNPIMHQLLSDQLISKWFFIRFADPRDHLRIRMHCMNKESVNVVREYFESAMDQIVREDKIWKLQLDTYKREIERYGTRTIDLAEEIFFLDSQCFINILDLLKGDNADHHRWLAALLSTDLVLSDFGLEPNEKLEFFLKMKQAFGMEFGIDKKLKIQLDKKFRDNRKTITAVLKNHELISNPEFKAILEILYQRSGILNPIAVKVKSLTPDGKRFDNYLGSYIHMSINRFFRSNQRRHEFVIYDLLYRFYQSEIARETKKVALYEMKGEQV